jgi:RNA polymerase primary sigma factor
LGLPLEPAFSLPETGVSCCGQAWAISSSLARRLGSAKSDEDGLDELLPEESTDRQSDWGSDDSEDRDAPPRQVMTAGAPDAVDDYRKRVAKVALLTAEQEVELAKRIEAGLFAEEKLKARDKIDSELRGELWWICQDGKNAKNHLLEANLRLVVSLATGYKGRGMLLMDLVQEGNLGLIHAVEKFDYTTGLNFSTYAMWWIHQGLTRALAAQARTILIPSRLVKVINKLAAYERWTKAHEGRLPTDAEIAAQFDLAPQEVLEIQNYRRHPVSLHELIPVAWDEIDRNSELTDLGWATELGSLIEDPDAVRPGDTVSLTLLQEELYSVLGSLSEREAAVVSMRYGLTDGQPKTLDDIGQVYGLTHERISRILSWAISKLRHPSRSRILRGYLDI